MAFDTKSLPEPLMLPQAVIFDISYGGGKMELGCIALAIHQVYQPPDFPLMEYLYASVIHQQLSHDTFSTMFYLVPLQFVTNVSMGFPHPESKFERPTRMMLIAPDKPAPQNRMPEGRIKSLLYEFGVQL